MTTTYKKKCLLYILQPSHIITGLSAIYSNYQDDNFEITIILYSNEEKPYTRTLDTIIDLTKHISEIKKIIVLSEKNLKIILSHSNLNSIKKTLCTNLENESFDELYYPHDSDSGLFNLLYLTLLRVNVISYGDAFGYICSNRIQRDYLSPKNIIQKSRSKIVAFVKTTLFPLRFIFTNKIRYQLWKFKISNKYVKPNLLAPIIPLTDSFETIKDITLRITKKNIAKTTLDRIINTENKLAQYIHVFEDNLKASGKKYLLITENNAEAGIMNFEREIDMYCQLITSFCEPHSLIILKSHPLEYLPRNQNIIKRLSGNYSFMPIDKNFSNYPIELFKSIIINCDIICMTTPSYTLKYLYDKNVINPLSIEFIKTWFPPKSWPIYLESLNIYNHFIETEQTNDFENFIYLGQ